MSRKKPAIKNRPEKRIEQAIVQVEVTNTTLKQARANCKKGRHCPPFSETMPARFIPRTVTTTYLA